MTAGVRRLRSALVLLGLGLLLACAQGEPPRSSAQPTTTYSFSIVNGSLPRFVFIGRERSADIELRNDGFNLWQGDREFFFSPRWLALGDGRVIEEGFRSPLQNAVAPGAVAPLTVRFKPPASAGLYRVQWDLLSDRSGWFSQFDQTPEPPLLVLVLPRVEFFLAVVVPCLVLLVLLALLGRGLRMPPGVTASLIAGSELLWCGASLLGKPNILYGELASKFWPGPKLVTFSVVALLLAPLCLLPRRLRPVFAWCLAAFGALTVWTQLVYYRFFQDLASSVAALAGRQAADLGETVVSLAAPKDLWLVIDLVLAIPVLWIIRRRTANRDWTPDRRRILATVLAVLALPFLWSGARALSEGQLQSRRNLQNLRSVSTYGLYGFQLLDAGASLLASLSQPVATEAEIETALEYFRRTAPHRRVVGESAGLAQGFNLIGIQVESLQSFVLEMDIAGQPVTPHLRRLRTSALDFGAIVDQTSRGRSSAADFAIMTSLLPLGESVAYEHPDNEFDGLAHALAEEGYDTVSAIPYKSNFWNRRVTHRAYGFEENLFRDQFERRSPRVGWGINDRDFFEQIVPILKQRRTPFFAWLTTLSVHYPYESFPKDLRKLELGQLEETALGNYLHGMHLFDSAFGTLLEDLDRNGLLDNTAIAIWGDHNSGLRREPRYREQFGLETAAEKFLFDRVPFLVWLPPGIETSEVHQAAAGHLDIAPTLLGLLGVDSSHRAFVGRNLLGTPGDDPVVHPQGKWLDGSLIHISAIGEAEASCWRAEDLVQVPMGRCAAGNKAAREQVDIVALLLDRDLQAEVARRLGKKPQIP